MNVKLNCYSSIFNRKIIKNLPEELIYTFRTNATNLTNWKSYGVNVHRMFDPKNGVYLGEMITRTVKNADCTYIYPEKTTCNALEIIELKLNKCRMGYGSKFIELAKIESRKTNCNGRIFLCASRLYDREHPSHIFYRKKGFTSVDKKLNKIMDDCIAQGKNLDIEYADNLLMYLPVEEKPRHILSGFSQWLNKLFK